MSKKLKKSANIDDASVKTQDLLLVVTTIKDNKAAKSLAHLIISNRLAACCNIIPKITSIYEWNNELYDDDECLMVLKTTKNRYLGLEAFIQEKHPYEVPEIIALSSDHCRQEYLSWVLKQTK